MLLLDLSAESAEVISGLEEIANRKQRLAGRGIRQFPADPIEELSRGREISRREENEDPIVSGSKYVDLSVARHVVDAGIRSRVAGKDDSGFHPNREAAGHGFPS